MVDNNSIMGKDKGKGKKMSKYPKLKSLKIHQIKHSLVGILDEGNKLIAQGHRFSEQSQDADHVVWSWVRKDYQ